LLRIIVIIITITILVRNFCHADIKILTSYEMVFSDCEINFERSYKIKNVTTKNNLTYMCPVGK